MEANEKITKEWAVENGFSYFSTYGEICRTPRMQAYWKDGIDQALNFWVDGGSVVVGQKFGDKPIETVEDFKKIFFEKYQKEFVK